MSSWIDFTALGQIIVVGLLAGAGLPAIFAIGLRALSMGHHPVQTAGAGGGGDSEQIVGGSPAGIAIAAVCFVIVLAAIGYGIYLIVSG